MIQIFKKDFQKVVEIPTGVTTKISTSLEGRILVDFDVLPDFDKPILKKWLVTWWEENNDEATDHYKEVYGHYEIDAVNEIYFDNPLARKITAILIH